MPVPKRRHGFGRFAASERASSGPCARHRLIGDGSFSQDSLQKLLYATAVD
jgi:hypothetical protein